MLMVYKLINMLLTLEAIKESKLNHISTADQKPKSFFPHAAKLSGQANKLDIEKLQNSDSKHHSTVQPRTEKESNYFQKTNSDVPFAFWYHNHNKDSLKFKPRSRNVLFY